MHMPSCVNFVAKNVSIDSIKNQSFFTTHQYSYFKIANSESLFDCDVSDTNALAEHAKESQIDVPTSAQLVESKVKDTEFCAPTGEHESNVPKL